jgi:hypothetical protein
MYFRKESHETAWLKAERDLATSGYGLPSGSPDGSPVVTENDSNANGELTRDTFIKTLKKVSQPLGKGKF